MLYQMLVQDVKVKYDNLILQLDCFIKSRDYDTFWNFFGAPGSDAY